jgi:serine/threonine protein phosphatase PrpC/vancomycin resistance protein YoaR
MGAVYVVADGVGPRDNGQLASQTVVNSTLEVYRREFDGSPESTLEKAMRRAGEVILDLTEADADLRGMASTCTAAVVRHSRLVIGHVGDSRAYLVRHGRARRLTQDHTWAAEQSAAQGVQTAELEQHPLRSAPTRLLGSSVDTAVDLIEEALEDGDIVILCTDGLTATLDDAAIARTVHGEDARGAADKLIRAARTAGSSDDISVSVLVIEPVVEPTDILREPVGRPAASPESSSAATSFATPPMALALLALAAFVAVALAIWLYQLTYSGRIYPGVNTLGADLGGRSVEEATRALETQFAEYARQPITLEVAEQRFFLTAGELGVRFDAEATAERAMLVGRSGSFLRQLFEQVRGLALERDTPLVYQVDDGRMQAALTPLAQRVEATNPPEDAALLIEQSGTIRIQASRAGRTVDRGASAEVIRERLQALGAGTLRLPTAEIPPSVSETDLAEPRAIAERVLNQPLTVTAGGESIQLNRTQLASILSVRKEQVDGKPRVSLQLLNGETSRLLQPLADRLARAPVHARFNWTPAGLTLAAPGVDGQELDLSSAAETLEQQLLVQGSPAMLSPRPIPAISLADAAALDIRELVAEGSLPLVNIDPWTFHNIERALGEVHGRLVMPGQTFSLLDAIGPIQPDRGFQSAPGDDSSVMTRGVNLTATTLFQAVFWSGYLINERNAPAQWTTQAGAPPRGQIGLDAAVDARLQRDFRFTNDSGKPLLIQSYVRDDKAIVALHGTRPSWNVQVSEPSVTGVSAPDADPDRRDDETIQAGQEVWIEDRSDGFSVSLQRTVTAGATSPRTLNLTSTYAPRRGRLLVGTKAD